MTKGIIEEIIDSYQVRVRIPTYHKIASAAGATPTKELPIAIFSTTPNINISYNVGDIVFVEFEHNDSSKPIITGFLHTVSDDVSSKLSELNVTKKTKLSRNTTIGEVTYQELAQLKGCDYNIDTRFKSLEQDSSNSNEKLEDELKNHEDWTIYTDKKNNSSSYGNILDLIFDEIYPIGSYYWTSNPDFNPNTRFNQEKQWIKITDTFLYATNNNISTTENNIGVEPIEHSHTASIKDTSIEASASLSSVDLTITPTDSIYLYQDQNGQVVQIPSSYEATQPNGGNGHNHTIYAAIKDNTVNVSTEYYALSAKHIPHRNAYCWWRCGYDIYSGSKQQ